MEQNESIWKHCLEYAALSDLGLRRVNNQDSYAVVTAGSQGDFDRWGHLFIVADGMGAHAAGELASKMATDNIPLVYRKRADQSPPDALRAAVIDANQQIHTKGQASPDFRGMGTTVTAMLLLPAGAIFAHVGDSRAYRLRDSRLEQLTFDHSLVWEMRAAGHAIETEAPGYISKNIITRSLGPNAAVNVDLEGPHAVQAGDTFLLCSDGLSGPVADDEIGAVLLTLPPSKAVQALVDLANLRGGPDNITAIIVRVLGPQVARSTGADQTPPDPRAGIRPIHPLVWMVIGVACLASAGLFALECFFGALAGLGCAFAAGVLALVQRYGLSGGPYQFSGRRLGRGPYIACECMPNADLLGRFADIARQLREAAANEQWTIDWSHFNRYLARAEAAAKDNQWAEAARLHLKAITYLMSDLRNQSHRNA